MINDMGLVEFAAELVREARKNIKEAPGLKRDIFSNRQSQAIASLGISRIIRLGKTLIINDLVSLAVVTSPPEAQKYSEMIALRILLGNEKDLLQKKVDQVKGDISLETEEESIPPSLTGKQLLLQEILDYLNIQKSYDPSKEIETYVFADQIQDELFNKIPEKDDLSEQEKVDLAKKFLAYENVGGRQGIIKEKIKNWDQLFEQAKNKILQSVPQIENRNLVHSQILGFGKDVEGLSRDNFIQDLSSLLQTMDKPLNKPKKIAVEDKIDKMSHRQLNTAHSTINEFDKTLSKYDINQESFSPSLKEIKQLIENKIKENANSLDDVIKHPYLFSKDMNYEKLGEMVKKALDYDDPLTALQKANEVDELLGTNTASRVFNEYKDEYDKINLESLLDKPVPSAEWLTCIEEKIEELSNKSWNENYSMTKRMIKIKNEQHSAFMGKVMEDYAKQQVESLISDSTEVEELVDAVDFARDNNLDFQVNSVREKGTKLGMSLIEISQLIGSVYEYLKSIIEQENPSYERVSSLMRNADLSKDEFSSLVNISIEKQVEGALGALANIDLLTVANSVPNTSEGKSLLERALGAGSGENLLNQWFKYAKNIPPYLRQVIKDTARRIMIDLAKAKASALIGSSEVGPLPEGTTRPYILGDDLDTIDIEESLDYILTMGKSIDNVTINDLIIRKNVTGRRCVVFLVDISGSMSGRPLASASLATAMLLSAFSRDELGVALFESNSHVICEIDEDIELDVVIDEILDLEAKGGTQMQAALNWAETQFEKSKSQDKIFVMLTDAMIGDFTRSEQHLRDIADKGATSILIVPAGIYGMGNIQSILEAANAEIVTVNNWKDFPDIVCRVLTRT